MRRNVSQSSRRHRSRFAMETREVRTLLAAITVTNTNDYGPGSLRQAILDANADPTAGVEPILLDLEDLTVLPTIDLLSPLPTITRPVSLDATTLFGSFSLPELILDGTKADGLTFGPSSTGSIVEGLAIDHFSGDGILLTGTSDVTIQDNAIGVDSTEENDRAPCLDHEEVAGTLISRFQLISDLSS